MSDNITNKISFANFDIYEKLLEIASKHVSLNNESDFLRLGLFGYVTEGMAANIRDNALQKTMLYNESFLNSAIIPDSVYNYARTFNVSVQNATPARALVSITIPESDFNQFRTDYDPKDYPRYYATSPNDAANYSGIIIDRDGDFRVNGYVFKLEKSIILSVSGSDVFSANYILTEQPGAQFHIDDPYAGKDYYTNNQHIVVTQDSAGNIVLHNVLVYQFAVETNILQITSDYILNKKVFYQTFNNQFAGMSASYIKNKKVYNVDLYYSDMDLALGTDLQNPYYAFYSLENDDIVKIKFTSGTSGFIPEINSQIQIDIYTTQGTNISTAITGLYAYTQSNTATRAVSILVSFESNLSGGRNKPTISQTKQQIINAISTRNIILSETDLNNYFSILTQSWSGFDGKIKFVKKRDDILRRVFGAYSLFRSGLDVSGKAVNNSSYISSPVPTNTINAVFTIGANDTPDKILIKSGTKFRQDASNTSEYIFERVNSDATDYDYFCPFTIKAMLSPVRMVKYISEMTDSTTGAHIDSQKSDNVYPSNTTIIPKNIHVKRQLNNGDGSISSNILVELQLQSNTNLQENLTINSSNGITISFNDDVTSYGAITQNSANIISTQVSDEESFQTTISFAIPVDQSSSISANASKIDVIKLSGNVTIPSEAYIGIKLSGSILSNSDAFTINIISDSKLTFFNSMNRIMTSDISYTLKQSGTVKYIDEYRIDSIPVVHKSFLETFQGTTGQVSGVAISTSNIENFVKQVSNHIMILKQSLNKLEANTTYDFKFYNTCGRAQYYDCMKTDLDLLLVITLAKKYANNETLKTQIRDYIRMYIDSCNNNNEFYMTGLVVACTGAFNQTATSADVIKNIEFRSMNGAMDDHILPFSDNADKEYMFVPEWFGLPFNPETNEDNIIFVSE